MNLGGIQDNKIKLLEEFIELVKKKMSMFINFIWKIQYNKKLKNFKKEKDN